MGSRNPFGNPFQGHFSLHVLPGVPSTHPGVPRVLPTRAAHGHPSLLGEDSANSRQLSPLIGW
eukprot:8638115-Pyramimonas_sp.AAC.1